MNKTAIKNFAIVARNKLIADISYRAGLMGITADGIHTALPQSTGQTEFYDIGTKEPYAITGVAIRQRRHLVELIQRKEKDTDYKTSYKYIIEEVAYTWFNRLIAVRFMEINDYLPSHVRVLSSESGKMEPDLVTMPFDADLEFTSAERQTVQELKNANKLDEVFRMLFIKQCNALNAILPALFEKTNDYSELLLNLSVVDQDGVVYHLVHDIPEEDFDVERGGQVEIIGWLYQFYNTELKDETFALMKQKKKITKERVPSATQIFTPDWIVRYMVENSLGRLWIEGHPNCDLRAKWNYYLEETEQEPEVQKQLAEIKKKYTRLDPKDIKVIDPCIGSGHILVYAFDVLMQIYTSEGYGERDAARSILENNLYGLDIDDRAFQMAYFAIMMKARQFNRRILNGECKPKLYAIQESNGMNRGHLKYFGEGMSDEEKKTAINQITYLLDTFVDAKEYGSILTIKQCEWELLKRFVSNMASLGQLSFEAIGIDETAEKMSQIIDQGMCLYQQYEIAITNPPYMGNGGMNGKLSEFVKQNYSAGKADMFAVFIERILKFTSQCGLSAMITQPSFLFLSTFEKLREEVILTSSIESLLHMGRGIFGIDFGSTSFVLRKDRMPDFFGKYFKLYKKTFQFLNIEDIEILFQKAKEDINELYDFSRYDTSLGIERSLGLGKGDKLCYLSKQSRFEKIPSMPFAYWASDEYVSNFGKKDLTYEAKVGLSSGDNDAMLRMWFEVNKSNIAYNMSSMDEFILSNKTWLPLYKGGDYRRWHGNYSYVINWRNNGEAIKKLPNSTVRNERYYLKEGLTWSDVSSGRFSIRIGEPGFIFADSGPMLFSDQNLFLLGLLNSSVIGDYMDMVNPTMHFKPGNLLNMPIIFDKDFKHAMVALVTECLRISKDDWDSYELSWGFKKHPLLSGKSIKEAFSNWNSLSAERFTCLQNYEQEINKITIKKYHLENQVSFDVNDEAVSLHRADFEQDIKSLLSFAVGCMFGRYSLDEEGIVFAGENWDLSRFSRFLPDNDNVLPITDEEYLEDDIVSRLCDWLKAAYGEQTLEKNLDCIADALGNKGDSSREIIRNYFLNDFFKDHCQTYSITGSGKRPIYWLFDSGKQNGFKALIYLHRYNADTIGNLRIDYLHRMQRVYESEISRMQDMIDHSTNAREVGQATKRRDKLTKQLKECREYDEKLAHLALSRIELDLDDGVKVNYRKIQTANDGKFYEVLADSKNIMAKK